MSGDMVLESGALGAFALQHSSSAPIDVVLHVRTLLHLSTSQYHVLDPTSTEIRHALLRAGSFAAAVEAIHAEFDVDESKLRADLERFVQQLADRGLVRLEPV